MQKCDMCTKWVLNSVGFTADKTSITLCRDCAISLGHSGERLCKEKVVLFQVVVIVNSLNVRMMPQNDSKITGHVRLGDVLNVVENYGAHWLVRYGEGGSGFVHKAYVKIA